MKLDTKALEKHGFNFLKSQYLDDYEINNLFTGVKSTKHTSFAEIAEETFDTIESVLDEHLVTIAHAAISPMHLMEKPLIDAKLEAIDLLSETIKCNPVLINEICTFVSLLNYYKKDTVVEPHGEIFITYFKSDEGSIHVVGKEFERLFNETYEYKTDKMLYSRDQFNDFKIMLYEEVKQVYDRNNKKTDSDYLKMVTDLLEKMDLCGTSYEKARVISLHKIMTKYGPQEILKKYKLIDSIGNKNLDMFIKHCEYLRKYKKHCRAVSVFSPLKLKYKNMSLLGESGKHIAENEMIERINDLLGNDHEMRDTRRMLEDATKELTQLLLDYPNDTHISPNKWINERSDFVLNSHKDPELYKQVCRMGYEHWDKKYSYVIKRIIESIDEFCETNEFGLQIPCISKQEQLLDDTLWDCVNAFAGLSTRDDIEILTNSTFFKNKFISTDEKIKICTESPLYTGPLTPDYIDKMIALLLAFDDSDESVDRVLIRTNKKMVSYRDPNKFIIKHMDKNIISKWCTILEDHFQDTGMNIHGSRFCSKKKWIDEVLFFISKRVENIQYGKVDIDEFKYAAMEENLYGVNPFNPISYKLLRGQAFLVLSEMANSTSMKKALSCVGNSIIESYNKDKEDKFEKLVKKVEFHVSEWSGKYKKKKHLFIFIRPLMRLLETISQTPDTKDKISLIKESIFYNNDLVSEETTLLVCEMIASGCNVYELESMLVQDIIENNHDELDEDSYDDIDYALSKVVEDNKDKPPHVLGYYKVSPIRPLLIELTKSRGVTDALSMCEKSEFYNQAYPLSLKIKLCKDILSSINQESYMRVTAATSILLEYLKSKEPKREEQEPEKKSFVREVMNRFKKLF